jgi:hypothetical protein
MWYVQEECSSYNVTRDGVVVNDDCPQRKRLDVMQTGVAVDAAKGFLAQG